MLPSILSRQLEKGLTDYIETTFPMTNSCFKGSLDKLIKAKDSTYHEPYISIKMPFRTSDIDVSFDGVELGFKPYLHQSKAFQRLAIDEPKSTIIATGTGSGKTECFMYPTLDYCYKNRGTRGVKVLIIYPMNALATDQAKRIAKEIYNNSKLRGNITVGMYVGGEDRDRSFMVMGKENVITDHETLLSNPPDILLTNYKMLDYLLVRPKDASLWRDNKPETLKYIVVDELHTFDGAQGTDLACLLRRLKSRLETPKEYICSIGTSATIGSGDSFSNILNYARDIFGENFDDDAVITEDRLAPEEFFNKDISEFKVPANDEIVKIYDAYKNDNFEDFIRYSASAWFDSLENDVLTEEGRIELANKLIVHNFTVSVLTLMKNKFLQNSYIIDELSNSYPFLNSVEEKSFVIDTLFALISHARTKVGDRLRPFLSVSVQLWIRELRRVVGKVSDTNVEYALATDLNKEQSTKYLPIVNCRDCGFTGWASIIDPKQNARMRDLDAFYNEFFKYNDKIVFLYPEKRNENHDDFYSGYICPDCLQVDLGEGGEHSCSSCGTTSIPIIIPKEIIKKSGSHNHYVCPHCKSATSISLLGLRSATAISATVSQMFSSKFNDDKKALTFSDNVQDAAHRAGFFNSRTWKFSLRSAIQEFANSQKSELSLKDFQDGFINYWKSKLSKEEYVSLFIAPNLTWMDSYEDMKANGRLPANDKTNTLIDCIDSRLKYEILLEYGLTSRIGRTLEKTASSIISFPSDAINNVANSLRETVYNEFGKTIDIEIYKKIVLFVLNSMKYNGAFCDHAYDYYLEQGGKDYLLSNSFRAWMPGKNSSRNTPEFLIKHNGMYDRNSLKNFCDISSMRSRYVKDISLFLPSTDIWSEEIPQVIFENCVLELHKQLIVKAFKPNDTANIYGLNTSSLLVTNKVKRFKCIKCGQHFSFGDDNSKVVEGMLCPSNSCYGSLTEDNDVTFDYYHNLYNNGDIKRIVADEHTGLLERGTREDIENVFKHSKEEQKPWDTNILSCTPTLEMGIDIGDLSSVILCSMPPAQSQYLQRVGRAGRKDGNSLVITVANARPHDLYFYASPREMIEGEVNTPKIFLDASAVLERQFVAFCFDNWIKSGIEENVIPKYVGTCLKYIGNADSNAFPYNFLNYVQEKLTTLLDNFFVLFPDVTETTKNEIRTYANGTGLTNSPMHMKIFETFDALKKQKESISKNIKELSDQIKKIESLPQDSSYDEEKAELIAEKKALARVIKNMTNKNVFNFLSDEGLLPNYAFPEDGITLKAILRKKEERVDDSDLSKKKKTKLIYEFNRPSSSAISEFAPLNNFYATGRKLTIDQIDLVSADITTWRLCPNCSHAEIEIEGNHTSACPQCGTPEWADRGQLRSMLKAQMVYSNMDYNKSKIDDESDDRKVVFYNKQLLVDINEDEDISSAYRMDNTEFPFGFEYVKKATIREINFGESNLSGEKFFISGVESIRKGFRVCKHCGKIQTKEDKPEHTYSCKAKGKDYDQNDYENCLFLYRELQTEALRLLIPATTLDSTKVKVESFEAAFMLGMKEYFGNVDHLRTCVCEAPVQGSEYRKQYLVVYDSIPGGTGYLKQLLQNDNFLLDVFTKSINVMENCSCKDDPQKDGCYHCLYGYRQSRNIGSISRTTALNMFRQIVSGKDNITKIESIGNIPTNSLADSELEMMFINSLSLLKTDSRPVTINKDFVNNKEGYVLRIGDCRWLIEPQVLLDKKDGVNVKCQPDFVMWPDKGTNNQKPVAIFTDGFTFHKNKTWDDTLKRESIRQSGKFRVWSLTFKDVQDKFKAQGDYYTDTLSYEKMPSSEMYLKFIREEDNIIKPSKVSALELLAEYLTTNNAEEHFERHSMAYTMSLMEKSKFGNREAYDLWDEDVGKLMKAINVYKDREFGETAFGTWIPREVNSAIYIYAGIKKGSTPFVYSELRDDVAIKDETYEKEWNGFWNFYNVMQFNSNFYGLTTEGIKNNCYEALYNAENIEEVHLDNKVDDKWTEILENIYDENAKQFARQCISNGLPVPDEVGYELYDSDTVVGECELLWTKYKIVYLTENQISDSEESFIEHGYIIVKSITDAIKLLGGK